MNGNTMQTLVIALTPMDTKWSLDKDLVVGSGVIITAILGLVNLGYNLRNNRRSSYVNAVTATRLKWIDELRGNLSRMVALIYECSVAPPGDRVARQEIFREITHLRMLIRLQLAPRAAPSDQEFEGRVETLFQSIHGMSPQQIERELNNLVAAGQEFLWKEWLKAKREAIYGDPYDRPLYRLRSWYARLDSKVE